MIFFNYISFYWCVRSCHQSVNVKQYSLIISVSICLESYLPWSSGSGSHKAAIKLGLTGWTCLFLEFGVLAQAHGWWAEFSSAVDHRSLFACWLWSRTTLSSKEPPQVPCHMTFFQAPHNSLSQSGSSAGKIQSCCYGLSPN